MAKKGSNIEVKYSEELGFEICQEISCTPKGLEELCRENPHWPNPKNIYQWRLKYDSFATMYVRAKQSQIEVLVNAILDETRDATNDFYRQADGTYSVNSAAMSRLRIRVDAIKWFASKLAPKIYGDRIMHEVGSNYKDELKLLE